MGAKSQFLRDVRKRISADQMEVQRRAHLFVARNTTLPAMVRHRAQLALNSLNNGEGRLGAVKNRCVETGRGRGECGVEVELPWEVLMQSGIISKFGLCRVSSIAPDRDEYRAMCCAGSALLTHAVPVPPQGARRRASRRPQGELVTSGRRENHVGDEHCSLGSRHRTPDSTRNHPMRGDSTLMPVHPCAGYVVCMYPYHSPSSVSSPHCP
jgi:small subunit ribosomal protein S14